METSQDLYDNQRRRIGRIVDRGDHRDIYDITGNRLGRCDERQDRTFDNAGRAIGFGDQLLRLLK